MLIGMITNTMDVLLSQLHIVADRATETDDLTPFWLEATTLKRRRG